MLSAVPRSQSPSTPHSMAVTGAQISFFAPETSPAMASTESASKEQARAAFDEKYPPGFFGRMRAFGPDGDYGRWLVEQPTVVKINGTLFVHGGLTDLVAMLGLAGINSIVRDDIESYWDASRVLAPETAGPPTYTALEETATRLAGARKDSRQRQAARRLLELHDSLVVHFQQQTSVADNVTARGRSGDHP